MHGGIPKSIFSQWEQPIPEASAESFWEVRMTTERFITRQTHNDKNRIFGIVD